MLQGGENSLDIKQFRNNKPCSVPDDQVNLGTILLCLRHAHKLGLLNKTDIENGKWKGLVEYNLLQKAVQHDNEQVRLD